MVACLEKSEGNADFHEIVDFLTASSVHYTLTVSPAIYASYIEQFWNTAHSQIVNDVKQIHATIDGKIIITLVEPFNDVYQTLTHTKKVFTNMKRKGKDFSIRVTPLFALMLAPPLVEGEGSGQPSEPQPAPSTTQPIIKEQISITESSLPQNNQSPRQALQEDTQFPQTSMPIPNVVDEAVFKEWDDRVVKATTTAASLDVAQASGGNTPGSDEEIIEQDDLTDFVPLTPHDSPLSGDHTLGSDEGRPNINELMVIYINLLNRVVALEQSKTAAQDLVIRKLKRKVKKLEKKLRARTPRMKLFKIGTSKRKSLDEVYVSKQGRKSNKTKPMFDDSDFAELDVDNAMENVEVNTASIDVSAAGPSNVCTADPSPSTARYIFEDEMMTIADTLMAIRSTRQRTTSIVIRDVEEEPRRATPVPTVQSQDKEIAQRLHEEEMAKLERMQRERVVQEEAFNATLIAEFDNVQGRMEADALLATILKKSSFLLMS
ncbi:hypothetical protein Tco_0649582 [Tanacetum coccineum]